MTKILLAPFLRDNFQAFVAKAFSFSHARRLDESQRYIEYICYILSLFIKGIEARLLINLPGRHLKTFICSICLPAFMLGWNPSLRFMVVAYDKALAEDIVRQIRDLMESSWYRQVFRTRISADHSRKNDFLVVGGGRVRAVPIRSVTGKGGDVIIFDDPHNATDWNDAAKKDKVVEAFAALMTRRDLGEATRVLVVGHRIAVDDLSAYIIERGDFKHICLPLFAPKDMEFEIAGDTWHFAKNEALRPNAFPPKTIKTLRKEHRGSPFWLHYQQGLGPREDDFEIGVQHFPFFKGEYRGLPIVISVDPATKTASSSRNVIHVYAISGQHYILLQAFAEHCTFQRLERKVRYFAEHYAASIILVEETGRGGDLVDQLRGVVPAIRTVIPRTSKATRLRKFSNMIRAKRILLKPGRETEDAIDEIVNFPDAKYDDHVDTMTNFLELAAELDKEPPLVPSQPATAKIGLALGSRPLPAQREVRGVAVAFYSRPRFADLDVSNEKGPAEQGPRSPLQTDECSDIIAFGSPGGPIIKKIR